MIYDLMPPLVGGFVIIVIIFLRQRGKTGREQQSARRKPVRPGLVLERSPKEKKAGKSSLSGPVMIALPLIVIGAWLAASYFTPGDPEPSPETAPENPGAEDSNVLSGRIVMGEDAAPAAGNAPITEAAMSASSAARNTAQAPAAPPPADPAASQAAQAPLSAAAQAMLPTVSRMEQVGLMPARGAAPAANRPKAQKPPVAASAPPKAAAAQPLAPAAKPAASASQTAPKSASAPDTGADDVILGGGRTFTVHLASFAERGNAEKYLGKLVTARVRDAFVTESTIEGRLWYRVMSGRFASQAEAEAHGSELRRRNLTASGGRYVIKSIP